MTTELHALANSERLASRCIAALAKLESLKKTNKWRWRLELDEGGDPHLSYGWGIKGSPTALAEIEAYGQPQPGVTGEGGE